jgi:hypothetical protein
MNLRKVFTSFTCSAVNVTVFDEFKGTVRVASSSVIAQDAGLKANNTKREIMLRFKILVNFFIKKRVISNLSIKMCHIFYYKIGFFILRTRKEGR